MAASGAQWVCVPCKRTFVSPEARAMHTYNSSRHPSCKPCRRGFINQGAKQQHIRTVHADTYCATCDRPFKTELGLIQHRENAAAHRRDTAELHIDFDDDSDVVGANFGADWDSAASDSDNIPSTSHFRPAVVDHDIPSPPWESFLSLHRWVLTTEDNNSSSAGEDSSYFNPISDDQESDDVQDDETNDSESGHDHPSSDSDTDTDTDTDADSDAEHDSDVSGLPLTAPFRNERTRPPSSSHGLVLPSSSSASRASRSLNVASSSSETLTTDPNPDNRPAGTSPEIKATKERRVGRGSGYTCPLCLDQDAEQILELSSIKCGHVFCTPCITRALDKKRQCPVCRSPAKMKHLRRIFLSF